MEDAHFCTVYWLILHCSLRLSLMQVCSLQSQSFIVHGRRTLLYCLLANTALFPAFVTYAGLQLTITKFYSAWKTHTFVLFIGEYKVVQI